jgi:hypothetical protein
VTSLEMASMAAKTAGKKLAGEQPSRTRAFLAASVVAVGAGVLTYKLLRSSGDDANGADA